MPWRSWRKAELGGDDGGLDTWLARSVCNSGWEQKGFERIAKNHKIARIKTSRRFHTTKCEPRSFRTTSYLSFEMP